MRVSGYLEKCINRVMQAASPTSQDAADLEDYRLNYEKHFNSIMASLEKLVMLTEGKEDLWTQALGCVFKMCNSILVTYSAASSKIHLPPTPAATSAPAATPTGAGGDGHMLDA